MIRSARQMSAYMEGREEGIDLGRKEGIDLGIERGLKNAVMALKGVLDPAVIAERFQMSLEQVMEILGQK